MHALAIDNSSITLDRVNATSNAASWDSLSDELLAGMLRSEGGALSVDGSIATITITHSHMADNMAGRVSERVRERVCFVCGCGEGLCALTTDMLYIL